MAGNWKQIKSNYKYTLVSVLILCNVFMLSGFAYPETRRQEKSTHTEWKARFKRAPKTLFYKKHCADKLSSKTYYDTSDNILALSFYDSGIQLSLKVNSEKIKQGINRKAKLIVSYIYYKCKDVASDYEIRS